MKYICEICDYSTDIHCNYQKHMISKKHIEKTTKIANLPSKNPLMTTNLPSEIVHECMYCDKKYKNNTHLSRHKKTCTEKQNLIDKYLQKEKEKDAVIKELQDKLLCKEDIIKSKDANLKSKDETILILTHETKNLKTMLNCAGTLVEKSTSNLSYLNKHYPNAPALEYITDIVDIPDLHEDLKEDQVVDNIIYEYKNHTLTSFIGDMIVKNYKKTDPTQQSLWNSDNDRLTYMIRSLLANESIQWEVDKKGINTTKYIIKPIIDYIKKQLENYIITCEVSRKDKTRKLMGSVYKMADCRIIIANINDGTLADNILKYISPHLYIVKETQELV